MNRAVSLYRAFKIKRQFQRIDSACETLNKYLNSQSVPRSEKRRMMRRIWRGEK